MDLKEAHILGESINQHWYFRAKFAAVRRLLGSHKFRFLLDVGAGSGYFSRQLLQAGYADAATCVDINYPADSTELYHDKPLRFSRATPPGNYDGVLLMDVLEHVEDDVGLLREVVAAVPSGAHFLISVPAFRFMWSAHDDFVEHKRRYTLPELEAVARRAGLQVQQGFYFFALVFPLALLTRIPGRLLHRGPPQSQLKKHHPWVNVGLEWLCRLELGLMRGNRLGGLTAFCLCRKL